MTFFNQETTTPTEEPDIPGVLSETPEEKDTPPEDEEV